MLLLAASVSLSVTGLIIGLILGAVIYLLGKMLADSSGHREVLTLTVVIAIVVFLICTFDVVGVD